MPECWPLESWLRQHTQKPRIREFTEAELPHKQYTGRHCGGGQFVPCLFRIVACPLFAKRDGFLGNSYVQHFMAHSQ